MTYILNVIEAKDRYKLSRSFSTSVQAAFHYSDYTQFNAWVTFLDIWQKLFGELKKYVLYVLYSLKKSVPTLIFRHMVNNKHFHFQIGWQFFLFVKVSYAIFRGKKYTRMITMFVKCQLPIMKFGRENTKFIFAQINTTQEEISW